jgi:hypothetical protein
VRLAAVGVAGFGFSIGIVGLKVDHQHAQRHAHLDGGEADARASYIVSNMSETSVLSSPSNAVTGAETCFRRGLESR